MKEDIGELLLEYSIIFDYGLSIPMGIRDDELKLFIEDVKTAIQTKQPINYDKWTSEY